MDIPIDRLIKLEFFSISVMKGDAKIKHLLQVLMLLYKLDVIPFETIFLLRLTLLEIKMQQMLTQP